MSIITITDDDGKSVIFHRKTEIAEAIVILLAGGDLEQFHLENASQEKPARKIHFERKPKSYDECRQYARSKGIHDIDAYTWFSQMEANGWTLSSGNPIKNWRAHLSHYQAEGWLQSQRGRVR